MALLGELWFCPVPGLWPDCRVHVGLWFHSARSLEVDMEEEGLKLLGDGRDDALDAECLRYSLGEEVVGLGLSIRPVTPSSEEEMWCERAEAKEELRTREGLLLTATSP